MKNINKAVDEYMNNKGTPKELAEKYNINVNELRKQIDKELFKIKMNI